MSENLRYIFTLTLICLITASLLTGVYLLTRPKILAQKEKAQKEALAEVFPQAGYFEPVMREAKISYFRAYLSKEEKKLLGYAFTAQGQGYSSMIETMAGIDTQGKITGVKILAQNETPGLGAKINEVLAQKTLWQAIKELFAPRKRLAQLPKEPWFCTQFKGKRIDDNFQAITGATISSQALIDSVRAKAGEILEYEQ